VARLFDDASTQYLEVDSAPVTAYPFTLACLFNNDVANANITLLWIGDKDDAAQYHALSLAGAVGGDPIRAVSIAATAGTADSSAGVAGATNAWGHACGVFTSATSRAAFFNGANKGTNTTNRTPAGLDRVSIGRLGDSTPTDYWSGLIAEAGVWDIALSDAEVALLGTPIGVNTWLSPWMVRPENLVAYWRIWGRFSPEPDRVGGFGVTVSGATVADHPKVLFPMTRRRISLPSATVAYLLDAAGGTITLSGTAATLRAGRALVAAAGSVAITGQAVALRATRVLAAGSGTVAVTGSAAGLAIGRHLSGDAGSYAVTGATAGLVAARQLAAAAGAWAIIGQDADLVVESAGAYEIAAAGGGYTISGGAAGLRAGRRLTAAAEAYATDGSAAALRTARLLAALAGTVALTGQAATLSRGLRVAAAPGIYAVTGSAVALLAARRLAMAAGALTWTGAATTLTYSAATTPIPLLLVTAFATVSAGSGAPVVAGAGATAFAVLEEG
jgi:hypothetical protein